MVTGMNIVEIFSSVQGEGRYVGCRQIFVRLAGCNLACDYCDTAESRVFCETAKIEESAGKRDFISVSNPISLSDLAGSINRLLEETPHHSVSFTGGEPLCQERGLQELLPLVKGRIYLETNGTLPLPLSKVIDSVDVISMDIKLPSVTDGNHWNAHEEFLRIANDKEVFVKMVLTAATTEEEFSRALQIIKVVNDEILLILQPVTPGGNSLPVSPDKVLWYQEQALRQLKDVRVIPQTHKFIGQL
jgi:organic radical activating enzyme